MSTRRVSYERLLRLETELTDRDRAIVLMLATLHLASGLQVRRAVWPEPGEAADRAARRALDRLVRWRVVARLERRVGGVGKGSSSWTLALDTAGQKIARGRDLTGARRPHLPRPAMWAHALLVSECYVRLVEHTRVSQTRLASWQGEPECWRTYSGRYGETTRLKPDGFTELHGPGYADLYFIEADTGSQSRTVIRAKCDAYVRYAASGQEQAARGVFPRVAFLATSPERVDLIADVLRSRPEREWPLFAVGLAREAGRVLAGDEA